MKHESKYINNRYKKTVRGVIYDTVALFAFLYHCNQKILASTDLLVSH